jgi:hypothetical protein
LPLYAAHDLLLRLARGVIETVRDPRIIKAGIASQGAGGRGCLAKRPSAIDRGWIWFDYFAAPRVVRSGFVSYPKSSGDLIEAPSGRRIT